MKELEISKIAKILGISNNAFKRIAFLGKLKYKTKGFKKYYNFDEVLKVIRISKE